jgi:hypothetical protein
MKGKEGVYRQAPRRNVRDDAVAFPDDHLMEGRKEWKDGRNGREAGME